MIGCRPHIFSLIDRLGVCLSPPQTCVGVVDSEGRLRALKGLRDTLGPPEPLVRATTCGKEKDGRLEVVQPHSDRSRETAPPSDG